MPDYQYTRSTSAPVQRPAFATAAIAARVREFRFSFASVFRLVAQVYAAAFIISAGMAVLFALGWALLFSLIAGLISAA